MHFVTESLEIREKNGEKLAVSQNHYNLGLLMLEQLKFVPAEVNLLKVRVFNIISCL